MVYFCGEAFHFFTANRPTTGHRRWHEHTRAEFRAFCADKELFVLRVVEMTDPPKMTSALRERLWTRLTDAACTALKCDAIGYPYVQGRADCYSLATYILNLPTARLADVIAMSLPQHEEWSKPLSDWDRLTDMSESAWRRQCCHKAVREYTHGDGTVTDDQTPMSLLHGIQGAVVQHLTRAVGAATDVQTPRSLLHGIQRDVQQYLVAAQRGVRLSTRASAWSEMLLHQAQGCTGGVSALLTAWQRRRRVAGRERGVRPGFCGLKVMLPRYRLHNATRDQVTAAVIRLRARHAAILQADRLRNKRDRQAKADSEHTPLGLLARRFWLWTTAACAVEQHGPHGCDDGDDQ